MFECPTCHELFDESGYCPHDRSTLSALSNAFGGDDSPTQGSTGTLTGSAVQSVLRNVLETRKAERLIGAELDGRYRIERQIGEGGMGMVFLAKHMVIEKSVAIKVLRAEVAEDEAVVKRFVQEARAASRIGHPNIIDVTDFGTTEDGLTYQVMEYLEGQTLSALMLSERTLTLTRALGIVAQMARALGAAHDKGIVHRDLKPENVFLMRREGRDDFVKIVDFGIAKVQPPEGDTLQPRLTRVGTVFGTPEYMSPEQASGRNDVDLRADIYALGIILYEMLCGRVPLRGDTTVRTLAMQMLDSPEPLRQAYPEIEITEEQEAAIMQALEKRRDDRYPSMADFLSALEDVTNHTELDLPRVMQQERVSASLQSQRAFDTVPEADFAQEEPAQPPEPSRTQAKTTPVDIAELAAEQGQSRKRRPSRATDPVFIQDSRASVMPLYDEMDDEVEEYSTRKGRSPAWIAMLLLIVGGGTAAYLLTRGAEENRAGAVPPDAAVVAMAPTSDASLPQLDSGASNVSDVDVDVAAKDPFAVADEGSKDPNNKNVDRKDAGHKNPRNKNPEYGLRRMIDVRIHTKPRGAGLYSAGLYSGPDGVTIVRPLGDRMKLDCHLNGYDDGKVVVKFDGKAEIYLCKMRKSSKARVKKCLKGTMNPFDECPDND